MSSLLNRKAVSSVLLVVFGAVMATLGGALATTAIAHGGDTSEIHACVHHNGAIRIVGPNDTCGSHETALDWNITGPPGPAVAGPPGPAGSPGISGYEQVTNSLVVPGHSQYVVAVACPAGKKVTGGGVSLSGSLSLDAQLISSAPSASPGWQATVFNENFVAPVTAKVVAICAEVEE